MVYVLNHQGQPLMPTEDHRKVRLLLTQRILQDTRKKRNLAAEGCWRETQAISQLKKQKKEESGTTPWNNPWGSAA